MRVGWLDLMIGRIVGKGGHTLTNRGSLCLGSCSTVVEQDAFGSGKQHLIIFKYISNSEP